MTPPFVALRETHTSVLFFVGDRVHKMKKPLDLGFLDNRDRATREAACHREVALNRRLAPDVYLGVADVSGPDGRPCEHLVEMRRLPDERRLSTVLDRADPPVDVVDALDDVARQVARLHAEAATGGEVDRCAEREAFARLWDLSLDHLDRLDAPDDGCRPLGAARLLAAIRDAARQFLHGRAALFEARIAAGRARDGHGDLLADDIFCLDDGARIIDCLEFDDELRFGDVFLDIAFLAMDLERAGRPDLARTLLVRYRALTGDECPPALIHHFVAYRATVRAKVAALRFGQGDADSRDTALALLDQARNNLRRGTIRLVTVGGLSGSGKTVTAATIGAFLSAPVLRSDVIRKESAGLDPLVDAASPPGEGLYSRERTEATYAAMLARAEETLTLGRSVVLDASWLSARDRARAADLAARVGAEFVEIECAADRDVRIRRVLERRAAGTDASDATPDVLSAQESTRDEWPSATVLDTTAGGPAPDQWLDRTVGPAPWPIDPSSPPSTRGA
ncbi:hypothetical protein SAMN05444695_110142 [Rhodococcus triatomae]|uniref:AAA family ATPase n=1 Tax=Rhodococcus triatomae TaxID=300028 RepID=A0A1G8N161_9NOCA|nr:AAA family ATPase [Rhodococcus triatomae]SDI73797.1 hypothetical protein SAMN05444695_110142 [Rhodococcus triatomae]